MLPLVNTTNQKRNTVVISKHHVPQTLTVTDVNYSTLVANT